MEQRLLSRFKWGLSADLQFPDLETRIAIINKKLYNDGVDMPEEVIEYLAYSINSHVRDIEGALISLLAQSSLNKKKITLDLARQMINKFVKNTTREISIDYIQKVVCDYFDMPVELPRARPSVYRTGASAGHVLRQTTDQKLFGSIGAQCGNKDHATVLHAVRTVNNLSETDKRFRTYVDDLRKTHHPLSARKKKRERPDDSGGFVFYQPRFFRFILYGREGTSSDRQYLEAHVEKKGRNGKQVVSSRDSAALRWSLPNGPRNSNSTAESVAARRERHSFCRAPCAKATEFLKSKGHSVKRVGVMTKLEKGRSGRVRYSVARSCLC